jgi:hypothetical protein
MPLDRAGSPIRDTASGHSVGNEAGAGLVAHMEEWVSRGRG